MKVIGRIIIILIRGILGLVAIHYTNMLLSGVRISVGVNIATGLTVGILGISGFLLLYTLVLVDQTL